MLVLFVKLGSVSSLFSLVKQVKTVKPANPANSANPANPANPAKAVKAVKAVKAIKQVKAVFPVLLASLASLVKTANVGTLDDSGDVHVSGYTRIDGHPARPEAGPARRVAGRQDGPDWTASSTVAGPGSGRSKITRPGPTCSASTRLPTDYLGRKVRCRLVATRIHRVRTHRGLPRRWARVRGGGRAMSARLRVLSGSC